MSTAPEIGRRFWTGPSGVPLLAGRYPTLAARDLIHVATCLHEGIGEILTPDRGFDHVVEIRRIDPADFGADSASDAG